MTEKLTPQVEMSLESAEHLRDQALQKIKDLQKEREGAIAREDELAALKLSEEIDKAKVRAEIEEVKVSQAQARLKQVNADRPQANKVKAEIQTLWTEYKKVVHEVSDLHNQAEGRAAEIPGIQNALTSKITTYERLSQERLPTPPFIQYLPYPFKGLLQILEWNPLTGSQQMQQSAPQPQEKVDVTSTLGEPETSQDLARQMRRYR